MSSKWFTPRGTGGVEANARRMEEATADAQSLANQIAAQRTNAGGLYASALGDMSGIRSGVRNFAGSGISDRLAVPSDVMSTRPEFGLGAREAVGPSASLLSTINLAEDPLEVERKVTDAYGTLGRMDLDDIYRKRATALTKDFAGRGLMMPNSGLTSQAIGLQNWRDREGARMAAEGVLKGIDARQSAQQQALASQLAGYNVERNAWMDQSEYDRALQDMRDRYWQTGVGIEGTLRAERAKNMWDAINYLTADTERLRQESDMLPILNALQGISTQYGNVAGQYNQIAQNNNIWGDVLGAAGTAAGAFYGSRR